MMLNGKEASMPTTKWDNDPRSSYLSAVRESQAAVLDVLRIWRDMGFEQLVSAHAVAERSH